MPRASNHIWYRPAHEHYIWYGPVKMALLDLSVRDWTYRDARRRMVRAGGVELARHTGSARLDEQGNRIVDCGCGWTGNGLGWAGHLDHVVKLALDAERRAP